MTPGAIRTRVWDLPTRLFHWALALTVIGLIATGLAAIMEWHFRLGYTRAVAAAVSSGLGIRRRPLVALLRFHLCAALGRCPICAVARIPDHLIGHTPLGALSVFAVLACCCAAGRDRAGGRRRDLGIRAADTLRVRCRGERSQRSWHTEPGKWLVITLVSLHVLAVLFYVFVKRPAADAAHDFGRQAARRRQRRAEP